jgi:hypothetical protein
MPANIETHQLIEQLAGRAQPVARMLPPWRRTALWLCASFAHVGVVAAACVLVSGGLPGAIGARLALELGAILATAATAAIAAFSSVVPGRDRRFLLLPLFPLAIWLATLGQGCLHDWQAFGSDGLKVRADWDCALPALILSVLPAGAMLAMLRRGAPLLPGVSLALGALAAAAIANFGLRIFHAGDVSIQVLVWHLGGAIVLALAASRAGHLLLNWRSRVSGCFPLTLQS